MLISNPDLINSCRVCRSPNQDGDYECLYQNTNKHEEDNDDGPVLSEAGILYENLLDLSLSNWYNYPQFLCNSCDLQMKLFKKLKNKAYKTWEYLQNLYEQQLANTKQEVVEDNVEVLEDYEEIKEAEEENEGDKEKELNVYEQTEMEECEGQADKQCQGQLAEEYYNQIPENNQEQSGEYQEETTKDCQSQNVEEYQEHDTEEYQEQIDENLQQQTEVQYQHHNTDEYATNSINEFSLNSPEEYADNTPNEYLESNKLPQNSCKNEDQTEQESSYINTNTNHQSQTPSLNIPLNRNNEPKITDLKFHYSTVEIQQNGDNSQETIPQITLELEPVIDKNDYVTEIYELLEDEDKTENGPENNENVIEYDVYTEDKTETNSVISSNVEYVIEEQMFEEGEEEVGDLNNMEIENKLVIEISNGIKRRKLNASKRKCTEGIAVTTKKREYKCEVCQLEFQNAQEQKQHRNEVHNKMFPCSVCGKELKSLPSLHLHMKIHAEKPAHQCEICQKTFNQKAHYQYHMKRHNNERNFKCDECEKAFITKTDLKVHQRLHTGIRPYVCNICNKDYMMMEHLKAHLLTHTDEYFQCDICKHKFATHKTLRQHVKTIHEDGAKFKCSFCGKAFRRKHHLEYHLRLHQKNVKFLGSHYELVDEPAAVSAEDQEEDFNIDADDPDELTDADLIVDTGFIALNDDLL